MYALDCAVVWCHSLDRRTAVPGRLHAHCSTLEEDAMTNHLRLPALALTALLLVTACGTGTATQAPAGSQAASAPPASVPASEPPASEEAPSESAEAVAPTPEPAADCAQSDADNAMEMWERSGGNKGMVDLLVCGWNEANPDKPINLSYIPHTEMVDKIARGIATGDVPDLMGM